tara:strand:- start:2185 stop:2922 length:738 start_codon:yes stop_codon:yes gene_type:complete
MRLFIILFFMFMTSCYSVVSEYSENEEILDYTYYINEGWNMFEAINLSDTLLIDQHSDYYDLSLQFFNIAIQAIDSEFSSQEFVGPYYKAYNGIGWNQLYYAGIYLNDNDKRDSLRNESIETFQMSHQDLLNSEFEQILNQDWCDMYLGLFYTNYYLGLSDTIFFNSSLSYSDTLLSIKPQYSFNHDDLDYKNIHYLRGKIYLRKQLYTEAYNEIKVVIEDCDPYTGDEIDLNKLFDCFDQFSNN